jgi:hypothetical protein
MTKLLNRIGTRAEEQSRLDAAGLSRSNRSKRSSRGKDKVSARSESLRQGPNSDISTGGAEQLASALSRVIVKAMKKKRSKRRESPDVAARQPLQELRDALLDLHKTLIDSERAVYETNFGPIQSPHHFFQLVSSDPWFAWLRPVSQLIVAMDEALDEAESLTSDSVDALMNESVFLLIPAERGGEFGERYLAALQRDPHVVLAHGRVAKRIGSRKPPA